MQVANLQSVVMTSDQNPDYINITAQDRTSMTGSLNQE